MQEVKRIRNERGLTQQQLCDLADVNKVTLIRIERGTGNPNVETLEKLADALGVEIAEFFPKAEPSLFDNNDQRRKPPTWMTRAESVVFHAELDQLDNAGLERRRRDLNDQAVVAMATDPREGERLGVQAFIAGATLQLRLKEDESLKRMLEAYRAA